MVTLAKWEISYQQELEGARAARLVGNEGKARVCARRAAGLLIAEYIRRKGLPPPGPSAYDLIRYLNGLPELPPGVTHVTGHLLLRINPDHSLPVEADLIAEVEWLKSALMS
jgi:hypothetical protein